MIKNMFLPFGHLIQTALQQISAIWDSSYRRTRCTMYMRHKYTQVVQKTKTVNKVLQVIHLETGLLVNSCICHTKVSRISMMLEFFCRFLQFLLICFFSCVLNKKSKIKVEHIVNNLGFSHSMLNQKLYLIINSLTQKSKSETLEN